VLVGAVRRGGGGDIGSLEFGLVVGGGILLHLLAHLATHWSAGG